MAGLSAEDRRASGLQVARAVHGHSCLGFESCGECRDLAAEYGVPLAELRRFLQGSRPWGWVSNPARARMFAACLRVLRDRQAGDATALALLLRAYVLLADLLPERPTWPVTDGGRPPDSRPPPLPVPSRAIVPHAPPASRAPARAGAAA